jgi:cell division septum initiation protein DivIVA
MVDQLEDRQEKLVKEIEENRKHAEAMERNLVLFSSLMKKIPQHVLVISRIEHEILYCNEVADYEMLQHPEL